MRWSKSSDCGDFSLFLSKLTELNGYIWLYVSFNSNSKNKSQIRLYLKVAKGKLGEQILKIIWHLYIYLFYYSQRRIHDIKLWKLKKTTDKPNDN